MLDDTKLIFTSTTGRSGTKYLANIINKNAKNATAEHEPYPRGNPINWYYNGEKDKLKKLSINKLKRLNRGKNKNKFCDLPFIKSASGRKNPSSKIYIPFNRILRNYIPSVEIKDIYLESTHLFIKTFGDSMYTVEPNLNLIHLTRDPLEVAKSFYNRNSIPGPNNSFLLNPLSKKNCVIITKKITDFQKCLWYWFETEIRHKEFINKHNVKTIFDIDINELNNIKKVKEMFKKFGMEYDRIQLKLGNRNENKKITKVCKKDRKEALELINFLPEWIFEKIGDKYQIRKELGDE